MVQNCSTTTGHFRISVENFILTIGMRNSCLIILIQQVWGGTCFAYSLLEFHKLSKLKLSCED